MVAEKMIQLARAGERDPDRLKQLILEAFEGTPNEERLCLIDWERLPLDLAVFRARMLQRRALVAAY